MISRKDEAIAEIRNCYISHCGLMRKLADGKETEIGAIFEDAKLWLRIRDALKICQEEGA